MIFSKWKKRVMKKKTTQKMSKKSTSYDNSREIIGVMLFFTGLFLVMLIYLGHFVATNEQEMVNNSYNGRQEIILSQNYRGTIYSAKGETLAKTVYSPDGTEYRTYPYNNLFSHVVGFSTNGKTGIEAYSNYYLINSNISMAEKIANTTAGVKNPGNNVYTTLDLDIQRAAYKALGTYDGAIIVTEVSTGKVLAMVSKPDYNPNEIVEIWDELQESDDSSVLLNRVTQGLYPPGSTFKIMTTLEYIRQNPDTYNNYSYNCVGTYRNGSDKIQCYHGSVHNRVSLLTSFSKSCNTSYANIGMNLDREQLEETLNTLLFNNDLPWDYIYSKSSAPINADMSDYDMLQSSIGQGKILITPLHLNMITCSIANNGILMEPYLVDRVEDANGKIIKNYKPVEYGALMTEAESEVLRKLMAEVVNSGTGTRMKGYGYTAGGKTGSAEYNSNKEDSHAWFTGFAPVENPQIAVTVIIEGAGAGGDYAVPMARRVFDAYFKQIQN